MDKLGPYRLVRYLGSGGMGSIFEAQDTHLGHRVALKRLHPHVAERASATERFLREGRAAARVRHPHVVQVLALGQHDGAPYLAMELLDGCDLAEILLREGRLSIGRALDLLVPVVAAVAAAHDAGVIHRDLKPSNVFVASGPRGVPWPKVVDFGISKVVAGDDAVAMTATDSVFGTIAYMAPEQARAMRDASFRSDQYSLAVILYQCVTGTLPFSGGSMYQMLQAVMTAPVVAPSERAEGLPSEVDAIVLRAMNRNPAERFPSVRDLGAALLPLAGERARVTWGAELVEGQGAAVQPARGGFDELGRAVATPSAISATLAPPTARATRAPVSRASVWRPGTVRGAVAMLVGCALVVGMLAVRAHSDRVRSRPFHVPAVTAAARSPIGPAPEISAPVTPSPMPADSVALSPDPGNGPTVTPASVPSAPLARAIPQRRTTAPMPTPASPSSATRTPSVSLRLGDNGAPILP